MVDSECAIKPSIFGLRRGGDNIRFRRGGEEAGCNTLIFRKIENLPS
jgi:hypothetical protein